jgi:hypothetical protein
MLLPAIEQSSGKIVLVPVNIFFLPAYASYGSCDDGRSSWRIGRRDMYRVLSLISMCEVNDYVYTTSGIFGVYWT